MKNELIIGNGLSSNMLLKKILRKVHWLNYFAIKINKIFKKIGIYL